MGTYFNTLPDYNKSSSLKAPKFRVDYIVNNSNISLEDFVQDNNAYNYGSTVVVLGYDYPKVGNDGNYVYFFTGYSKVPNAGQATIFPGDDIIIKHNIKLYAVWEKVTTFTVTIDPTDKSGVLKMKDTVVAGTGVLFDFKNYIHTFRTPEYFNNIRVKTIDTECFLGHYIDHIIITPNIAKIKSAAFKNWYGSQVTFVESAVTTKYPALEITLGAFSEVGDSLVSIVFPYRFQKIKNITGGAIFPSYGQNKHLEVFMRTPRDFFIESAQVDDMTVDGFICGAPTSNFDSTIYWGWND